MSANDQIKPSTMPPKKQVEKPNTADSKAEGEQLPPMIIGSETLFHLEHSNGAGNDLHQGMVVADEFVTKVMDRVDEALTVIETVKKIPEYNADLTVEMAMRTARLKVVLYDPRCDDVHIKEEEVEPVPLSTDNCMREGIETKPLPLLDIGNIDLINKNPSPLRTMKTMGTKARGFRNMGMGNQT